jgi:hypothetical protein
LDDVIDIRKIAIDNFSENNVPFGTPNSVLAPFFYLIFK